MANKPWKIVQLLSHQGNASRNHNAIPVHTHLNATVEKADHRKGDKHIKQLELLFPAGKKVNACNSFGKLFDSIYLSWTYSCPTAQQFHSWSWLPQKCIPVFTKRQPRIFTEAIFVLAENRNTTK